MRECTLTKNQWTHLALQYEREKQLFQLIVNCKHRFLSREKIELPLDVFKGKRVILGGDEAFEGVLTEFRVRKQVFPLEELLGGHRTPLPIVAEKKKNWTMKIKEKPAQQQSG